MEWFSPTTLIRPAATFSRSRERRNYGVVLLHSKRRAEASGGFRLRQLQLRFRPRGFVVRAEDELNVGMHGGVADFADELARGE